jgi:hypothetical protein
LSEPIGMFHNQFHLLSNVMNGPMSILIDGLLNSCSSFRSCAAGWSPCVFIIMNWCVTGLEPGISLKHLHTTQDLVPKGLLNHCEGLCSTFPKIGTFVAHLLFLLQIHHKNHHRSPNKRVWKLPMSAMCNLAHWLTRHGSPNICQCFALLLYRWRHRSGIFWIPPCNLTSWQHCLNDT